MGLIRLISLGDHLGFGDGRRASAVAVHFLGVPVDIVTDGPSCRPHRGFRPRRRCAGTLEQGTGARSQIWALEFLLINASNAPTPANFCQQGSDGQPAPNSFRPSSSTRSLQAASSAM